MVFHFFTANLIADDQNKINCLRNYSKSAKSSQIHHAPLGQLHEMAHGVCAKAAAAVCGAKKNLIRKCRHSHPQDAKKCRVCETAAVVANTPDFYIIHTHTEQQQLTCTRPTQALTLARTYTHTARLNSSSGLAFKSCVCARA